MARYTMIARAAQRFLRSPRGKQLGSTVLNRAAGIADRATGAKHAAKIEQARAAAERGLRRL